MLINTLLFVFSFLFLNVVTSPTPQSHSLIHRDNSLVDVSVLIDPDGSFRLTFSVNGITQGYLIETTPNSTYPYYFIALDASGKPIDPAAFLKGAVSGIPQLMIQLANMAQQFGKGAWNFLMCIGWDIVTNCLGYFWGCANKGTLLWECVTGLVCVAVHGANNVKACIGAATGN